MIIYIHGFNSSPASHKANLLRRRLEVVGRGDEFACPALSHWPEQAITQLEAQIATEGEENVVLVGSSLGGYYATAFAERTGCKSVVVNPAITPHEGLRAYLGPQKNLYTGEQYELTRTHLAQLQALYVPELTGPDRYLLIHTTGDELLDWRIAVDRYRGCRQVVIDGSDHGFSEFGDYIDIVLAFAES
jgi:predicted esterase YcpF (UPF0227 family)